MAPGALRASDAGPLWEEAVDLAGTGLMPAGSFANKSFCSSLVDVNPGLDTLKVDLVFDAQTSGGLVLAVPEHKMEAARGMLLDAGDLAQDIGRVWAAEGKRGRLRIV